MTHETRKTDGDQGGYVVRVPCGTDALGKALRGVFRDDARLPEEMVLALHRLDRLRP